MDVEAMEIRFGPRPRYPLEGPGGCDPAFIKHQREDKKWLQRAKNETKKLLVLAEKASSARRDRHRAVLLVESEAEIAIQRALATVTLDDGNPHDPYGVKIQILETYIDEAKKRLHEVNWSLGVAYDILNEEYPDDDGDAGDPEDIEDLKIAQSDLETEINDLA